MEFTVEGLTLLNGKAASASVGNGGGLLVHAGAEEGLVTVRHNQILNNIGSNGGGAYVLAGIISLTATSLHDNQSSNGQSRARTRTSITSASRSSRA